MLDLDLYRSTRLHLKPRAQRWIADAFLRLDYRRVDVRLEHAERIPEGPVLFAMNHTDNYNYWPFQYWMHRHWARYTATWVKGKNYEHPVVSTFMRSTNNIPIASRGYLITRDFKAVCGRRPEPEEYRALRAWVDGEPHDVDDVPDEIAQQGRDLFGRRFAPERETYAEAMEQTYGALMRWFVGLNHHALGLGLDLLVFPQGTRSIRLSRGHIGVAQAALAFGVPVVPIGCNGCDRVYPGTSFVSRPGRVVYRAGAPLSPAAFADIAPDEPFEPFTRAAERAHTASFQAVADRIMEHIEPLLDERHRFAADRDSDGTRGTERFL